MRKYLYSFVCLCWLVCCVPGLSFGQEILLKKDAFRIVVAKNEDKAVLTAVENIRRDFTKIMGSCPSLSFSVDNNKGTPQLIIVNQAKKMKGIPSGMKPLDGFESHRVYADVANNRIYVYGADMRGTIYAIYSFSEQILGVPPLWFFSSWQAEKKELVRVPASFDYSVKSPQVRFRTWFPNDQDLLSPWEKLDQANRFYWMEALMRLKLNSIEVEGTVEMNRKLSRKARDVTEYGLILSSHHFVTCNITYKRWDDYWLKMRKMEKAPELLIANEAELEEFWRYAIETVHESGIENLWTISCRGSGDRPFWATFKDAPESDKERGVLITKMLNKQIDLIREITGNKDPYVRITFYDEMSDLLSQGHIEPPVGSNVIWTYVAARRDHYPNEDIVNFDVKRNVKLGYYMNLQFTSTGAHLAHAEGPWKMEFNYRYLNSKAPLFFSVVNAGNVREFVFTMSANAAMMWDFNAYDTDRFVLQFCRQYVGEKYAPQAAKLYKDYFYSYWEQKKTEFPGMERQFIFQDLRYARLMKALTDKFYNYKPNPLEDFGFERMAGRAYRIVPEDNGADNQVDAILNGMRLTIPKFEKVAEECSQLMPLLEKDKQTFFNDDLRTKAYFMAHISKAAYHTTFAYKHQNDRSLLREHIDSAIRELETARDYLFESQHGAFETWYAGDAKGKFDIASILRRLNKVKKEIPK